MKLELGVMDEAYSAGGKTATTTYQVAKILEANYGVMRTFVELHGKEIDAAIGGAYSGAVEQLAFGGAIARRLDVSPVASAFRTYLESREYERVSGASINAAVAGVSHRKLHPYSMFVSPSLAGKKQALHLHAKLRAERPAFIDTGLYRRSFRAELVT